MSRLIKLSRRSLIATGASAVVLPAHAAIVNSCGNPINSSGPLSSFPGLIINGAPPATITLTSVPSSASIGVGVPIQFSYTTSAPTGMTAVWNPGGISGAVTGFTASGGTGSATVAAPSATGTYTLTVTGTGPNSASATAPNSTVISISSVQAPFAVRLGTFLGGGGGTEGSISAHMAAVRSQIAVPKIVGAVIINSYQDGFALPSQWGGDVGVWTTGNGLAVDGSMVPQLDGHFTNGTSTDCDYAGVIAGNYDTALINAFNLWKAVAPFPKIYFRINWEFNTNFRGWGVPSSGQVSQWIAAYKHWANVLHTWGNQSGNPQVRMVWSPDTSYTNTGSSTFNLPVINFFPAPDGSAVNGRYIDVIGNDNYMNGYGVNGASNLSQGYTTPLASNTNWSLGTFAKMAQTYRCNIGLSETGDGPAFDNNASATNGVMSGWANFFNTLAALSPAVPIEYLTLYDVSDGNASQQSGVGNFPVQCQGWNCALGNAATQPGGPTIPKIMTIAPI